MTSGDLPPVVTLNPCAGSDLLSFRSRENVSVRNRHTCPVASIHHEGPHGDTRDRAS